MRRLFIEPLDVLLFRNERSFTARESRVAKLGVISPLTFEGAIKSKIFLEFCEKKKYSPNIFQRNKNEKIADFKKRIEDEIKNDKELEKILKLIGHPALNEKAQLNVRGVFYAKKEKKEEFFSIPNDILWEDKDDENKKILKITPSQIELPKSKLFAMLSSEYPYVKEINDYIELSELKRYLFGSIPEVKIENSLALENLIETRTGIQLKFNTKITEEGHLYTAEFLRLPDGWGFTVWYESPYNISNGIIKLGGEGKGALCEEIDDINLNEKLDVNGLIEYINKDKRLKLYLATPSYFQDYKPPEEKIEKLLGVKLNLIGALPGKPIYMGGYDFAKNVEKPLKRWVNAGAVYYYKFEEKINSDLVLPLKIEEENIDMGCGFIGRW